MEATGIEATHLAGAVLVGDVTALDPDLTPQPVCVKQLAARVAEPLPQDGLARVREALDRSQLAADCAAAVDLWFAQNFGDRTA